MLVMTPRGCVNHIHILGIEVDVAAMEAIAGEYIIRKIVAYQKIYLLLSLVCKLVSC